MICSNNILENVVLIGQESMVNGLQEFLLRRSAGLVVKEAFNEVERVTGGEEERRR